MTFSNNIFLERINGWLSPVMEVVYINNSIVDPQVVKESLSSTTGEYREFNEKILRFEGGSGINAQLPFNAQRTAMFNNSLISSNSNIDFGSIVLFTTTT